MRPRGIPAENLAGYLFDISPKPCFNEAAGNTRGKHTAMLDEARENVPASMRPRGIPAENDVDPHGGAQRLGLQ